MTARILVVDDQPLNVKLLEAKLTAEYYDVITACNGEDALAKATEVVPDIILLDVMMPGESGLDLTDFLRPANPVPILLLTAMGEAANRVDGLERGADDYLTKPFEPRELLLRITSILRRAGPANEPAELVHFGVYIFDPERAELRHGDQPVRLTTGEASLLGVFAANPGVTLSRQILGRASRLGGNERAVDVHMARLRRKVEEDPKSPRYLQTVWGEGYVLRTDS